MIHLSLPGKESLPCKDQDDFFKKLVDIGKKIEVSSLSTNLKVEKLKSLHLVNDATFRSFSPDMELKIKYNFGELMVRLGVGT